MRQIVLKKKILLFLGSQILKRTWWPKLRTISKNSWQKTIQNSHNLLVSFYDNFLCNPMPINLEKKKNNYDQD